MCGLEDHVSEMTSSFDAVFIFIFIFYKEFNKKALRYSHLEKNQLSGGLPSSLIGLPSLKEL